MWPKIEFGAQIFVTGVISKFMGEVSRKIIPRKHGRKQGRKTTGFESLVRIKCPHNEIFYQMFKHGEIFGFQKFEFRFRLASFFVSPARHGEAQDMSGA